MHGSPVLKFLGLTAWLITALVSLHIGLVAMGWDLTAMAFVQNNLAMLIMPMRYIIGLAGLWSLIAMVMMLMGMGCCKCGCNADCDKKQSGYGM